MVSKLDKKNRQDDAIAKGDKHTAIIAAAQELFTSQGYEATTIAQIASKASVGIGTVYFYFKNKVDVLVGVQASFEARFAAYLNEPALQAIPHHQRIRPLIERSFSLSQEQHNQVQLMGLQPQEIGALPGDKEGSLIRQLMKAFIEQGVATQRFRPIDTDIAAGISFAMVGRALEECFKLEHGQNQPRYIATLVDALERWLVAPEYYHELHPSGS